MIPAIVYVGEDAELLSQLAGRLAGAGYRLEQASPREVRVEELLAGWLRLLILDMDVARPPGLELLRRLKADDAGVPVIVLGDGGERPLTAISVARQNGAERFFFRAEIDLDELAAAIDDAFRRLAHWETDLERLAERPRAAGWPDR
jgi:DNA-binding response OmpR family regulator